MTSRDLVPIILATAIGIAVIIAVASAAWRGQSLSDNGREVLIAIVSAMIGGAAGYTAARKVNGH